MATASKPIDSINRANAQHSSGPKTDEGKRRSAMNAFRHGLTGQLMMLPAEELVAYKHHCQVFLKKHQPADEYEARLVQVLADTAWRLMRVPAIESSILAYGAKFYEGGEEGDIRVSVATALECRNQAKALANITLYEQRLTRQFERTLAQLQALQAECSEQPENREEQQVARANGFVFSTVGPSPCSAAGSPDPAPPSPPHAP